MKVYVCGNELVKKDRLPLKLLPKLRRDFPHVTFLEVDPNENFIPEGDCLIIDSVKGIQDVQLFHNLEDFSVTTSVTPHDYDLGLHLRLLLKLGKIHRVKIIAVPQLGGIEYIMKGVKNILRKEVG